MTNSEQSLKGFETTLQNSLKGANSYNEFDSTFKSKIEEKRSSIIKNSRALVNSANTNTDEEERIKQQKLNLLKQQVLGFDSLNTTGSKEEFLLYIDQIQYVFSLEVNSMANLSVDKRNLLIAQGSFELGLLKILANNSDSFEQLEIQNSKSSPQKASARWHSWWSKAEQVMKCTILSGLSAGCWIYTPEVWWICSGFSIATIDCWYNYATGNY